MRSHLNPMQQKILELIRLLDISVVVQTATGERRYGRDYLRSFLLGMWDAATRPFGTRILFFSSVENYGKHTDRCERDVRYILRMLEDMNILILVQEANTENAQGVFRHTATHELNLHELRRRCREPLTARNAEPEAGEPKAGTAEKKEPHVLTHREARKFVEELRQKMVPPGTPQHPDSAYYVAPMPFLDALKAVCAAWMLDLERTARTLTYWGYHFANAP